MNKQQTISFRAPQDLIKRFDDLCDQLHINKSDVAREWLENAIPELEDQLRAKNAIRKARTEKRSINLTFQHRLVASESARYEHAYESSYALC